jgi:flagellar basal body rod protein FlgG
MDRGIYTAASGGLVSTRSLDVIANNLANVNTVGFKAERVVSRQQTFEDTLASTLANAPARAAADADVAPGVVDIATKTDFTMGPVAATGNPLDAALTKPNQFFVVQTEDGEAYTRAGNFQLNSTGILVTADGLPVLGDGGQLVAPPNGTPSLTSSGDIIVNKESIGKLRVVEVANLDDLQRKDGVRFVPKAGAGQASIVEASIVPGAVEMPNVNAVSSMVDMINAQRSFEAYTKLAKELSELDDLSIRNAGRG